MMTLRIFINQVVAYNLAFAMNHANLATAYKYANGCGAKGGIKFPKTMWGLNIEAACQAHDMDWEAAQSLEDLEAGNEVFDNNLKRIIDAESNWFTKRLRRARAAKYVTEVELIGTPAEANKRGFI